MKQMVIFQTQEIYLWFEFDMKKLGLYINLINNIS